MRAARPFATTVKIDGYKGVAPHEGTAVLEPLSPGHQLTFWMATLNLLSHYFGGALARPPVP